ncbi:MAG: trypsin-like peptidase domain-containing protein [Chitinophagaceae bacterium]|nr:trypsin-like peptidase domain-containing protein [Chitinophagaceae bacterium]
MQIKDIPKLFHIAAFLFLLVFNLFACIARAQHITAAENYGRNRAGVVMVKTQLSAIVNVSQLQINNRAFNTLVDSISRLTTDNTSLNSGQKLDIVINRFRDNADKYFKSTLNYFRYAKEITSTGTGFFFRGDGYVLTNCHVVDESDSYIRRRLISSVFRQVTASNIEAIENSWQVNFSETQRDVLADAFAGIYSRILPISLDSIKKSIFVVVGSDEEGSYKRELPAEIIVKGSSMPGKDVAILKVAGKGPHPTITMLEEEKVRVGERVFVYGYPETVTNNEFLSKSTALEPTLTNGIVSAWKQTILNWPVIQMDANINHGSSGGPVCNEEGKVVGMTTFGSLEMRTGALAAGFNFAIPVSVLKEFFKLAGVEPEESSISRRFNEALSHFNAEYYRKALAIFREVKQQYPSYPGIAGYIEDCELNIRNKKDKEPGSRLYLLLLIVVVLAVTALVMWLNVKKRS